MSVFDTHGGYFAPKGYTRVNEGGSHDENPNGGVQMGVTPDGAPNLLEEGEPVYQDYVFSDNINAEREFLDKHHLPASYDGKLYSEIADKIVDEAEERPLDPISRNGLNAMLSRLTEAQEEQKAVIQQRDLEKALSQLSPEELDVLEQAAMQSMYAQAQPQEPMPEEQIAPDQFMPLQPDMAQVPEQQLPEEQTMMGFGGPIHRYDWGSFLDMVKGYKASLTPGNLSDKYAIDRGFDLRGFNTLRDLENSADYRAFTDYVLANPNDPNVRAYLEALDAGTVNADKLFVNGALRDNWQDLYRARRYDNKAGIYHLYDRNLPYTDPSFVFNGKVAPRRYYGSTAPDLSAYSLTVPDADLGDIFIKPVDGSVPTVNAPAKPMAGATTDPTKTTTGTSSSTAGTGVRRAGFTPYPTFPRYAGAIGAGLLGLYDAVTPPDRYTYERAVPYTPYGNINLQNQRYMPVDPNVILNAQLAQSNSTARAIQNSTSPSTAAGLLALDNNTTRNIGTGLLQGMQANNQQRNAVLAANNQTEAQRAQFDFGVDTARVNSLNLAQRQNIQNNLMTQRFNNLAETEKYAALSNQINAALGALTGIGTENYRMNQANSNTAFGGYGASPNGVDLYGLGAGLVRALNDSLDKEQKKCGGTLLKKYKK